jgi:hypothetical protein
MRTWLLCPFLVAASMVVLPTAPAQARDMIRLENSVAPVHVRVNHHARHRHHFGVFAPFGLVEEFVDDGSQGPAAAEAPEIVLNAPAPAASQVDRPPCHEVTPEGVTIDRGLGCRRAAR